MVLESGFGTTFASREQSDMEQMQYSCFLFICRKDTIHIHDAKHIVTHRAALVAMYGTNTWQMARAAAGFTSRHPVVLHTQTHAQGLRASIAHVSATDIHIIYIYIY